MYTYARGANVVGEPHQRAIRQLLFLVCDARRRAVASFRAKGGISTMRPFLVLTAIIAISTFVSAQQTAEQKKLAEALKPFLKIIANGTPAVTVEERPNEWRNVKHLPAKGGPQWRVERTDYAEKPWKATISWQDIVQQSMIYSTKEKATDAKVSQTVSGRLKFTAEYWWENGQWNFVALGWSDGFNSGKWDKDTKSDSLKAWHAILKPKEKE
jgi:hypothetical protein